MTETTHIYFTDSVTNRQLWENWAYGVEDVAFCGKKVGINSCYATWIDLPENLLARSEVCKDCLLVYRISTL